MSFQDLAENALSGGEQLSNATFGAAQGALGVSPETQQDDGKGVGRRDKVPSEKGKKFFRGG